jgi:hypothetical protein
MLAVTNNAGLFCRALLGTLIALALALNASAQTFPLKDKPITIVVPFSAGGPTDRLAREMAEGLRKPFGGANIVVENILGAGGAIATQKVAKAAPDGHTILIHHIGMATMPSLVRKLGFDVDNDFTYLGMIHEVPMTIVARPRLGSQGLQRTHGLGCQKQRQGEPGQRWCGVGFAFVWPLVAVVVAHRDGWHSLQGRVHGHHRFDGWAN